MSNWHNKPSYFGEMLVDALALPLLGVVVGVCIFILVKYLTV